MKVKNLKVSGFKFKLTTIILSVLMAASLAASAILLTSGKTNALANGSTNQITLYTEAGGWSRAGYDALAQKLNAVSNVKISNKTDNTQVNADDLRTATSAGGSVIQTGDHVLARNLFASNLASDNTDPGKEWSVLIGGIEWTPTYLSYSSTGDLVLTLWQADRPESAQYNPTVNLNRETFPRANNYSTSYIRTHVLNNGGTYYVYEGDEQAKIESPTPVTVTPSENNTYSLFTTGALANYIVAPNQMPWQANEAYNVNDLAYTVENGHDAAAGYSDNAASNYTAWGADKVWLPSKGDVIDTWGTTINQRKSDYGYYWLRTPYTEDINLGMDYNEAYGLGLRLPANGGYTTNDYPINNATGFRPCIHLNITKTVPFTQATTGYSTTASTYNTALATAWNQAISNSTNTGWNKWYNTSGTVVAENSSDDKVAHVYYDANYDRGNGGGKGAMVFQLLKDWGAPTSEDNAFSTGAGFDNGAIYVPSGKYMAIDLNMHTINRNLYNKAIQLPYGYVIRNSGYLIVDDSAAVEEYLKVDETGVRGCGRITGGSNLGQGELGTNEKANCARGGGINNFNGRTVFNMGAICYNKAVRGSGINCHRDTKGVPGSNANNEAVVINGGIIAHCSGNDLFYVNVGSGANSEGQEPQFDQMEKLIINKCEIAYNRCSTAPIEQGYYGYSYVVLNAGVVFHHNFGATAGVDYMSGIGSQAAFKLNKLETNGGIYYANTSNTSGVFWIGDRSVVNIKGGEYYDNIGAGNGGCIYMDILTQCTMDDGEFRNNKANGPTSNGGGICIGQDATFTMNGGSFINNSTTGDGGGIYMATGTFNMNGGLFKGNSSVNGGGLYLGNGTFNMNGGTFEANTCKGNGGGIYIAGGSYNMTGGSFIGNSAMGEPVTKYTYTATATTQTTNYITSATSTSASSAATITSYQQLTQRVVDMPYPCNAYPNSRAVTTTNYASTASVPCDTGRGGGIYIANGRFVMSNGAFDKNYAGQIGGAVYMADGVFVLDTYGGADHVINYDETTLKYSLNHISYTNNGADATNSNDVEDYLVTGNKIDFTNNIAPNYPGFYCPTVYFAGNLQIKGNETPQHIKRNVHLVNKMDGTTITERAVVYVTAPLDKDGYIGISKDLNASGETWTAVGYKSTYVVSGKPFNNYEMTVDDLLCIRCDAGDDYLFSVKKGYDEVSKQNDVSYMYLSRKPAHIHSWQKVGRDPSCTTQGYLAWVCTGCQEILDPTNTEHTGSGKFSPDTSGFTAEGLSGPLDVTKPCEYIAPTGHEFKWNSAGYFDCQHAGCTEKLYFDYDQIDSLNYTSRSQQVSISQIDWRLYSKGEDGAQTEQTYVYTDSGNAPTASVLYFGNTINVGDVSGYIKLNGITQKVTGTYTVPYGSGAGREVTGEGYEYTNTVTSDPKSNDKKGPEITYEITKSRPKMDMTLPESTRDVWYVSDSANFFGRIEYNVTVTGANNTTVVLDENGMDTPLGTLSWSSTTLTVGTDVLYTWTWTPNNINNLDTITGNIYVTARDNGLWGLTATRINESSIIRDNATMAEIGALYQIVATFTRDELGEDTFDQTISATDSGLRIALLTAQENGTAYSSVRAGSFYVRFTYTYGTDTEVYVTENRLTILSQPMKHIRATMPSVDDYTIYDNQLDLDEALTQPNGTSYITVLGWDTDDIDNTPGTPITAFTLSCDDWGSGAGMYEVVVNYGTCEPQTVQVKVTANRIKKLEVLNWNQHKVPIVTKVAGDKVVNITNYADFTVQATYDDGSTKVIPKSVDNQLGYTLAWTNPTINVGQLNSITINYKEASEHTLNVTSDKSCTVEMRVNDVQVNPTDINYSIRVGQTIDYPTVNADTLASKIIVTVIYSGETVAEEIPYGAHFTDAQKAGTVYYGLSQLEYDPLEEMFYFNVRAYYGNSSLNRRLFSIDASRDDVEDITVGKTTTVPSVVTNLITLDFYVSHYITITENRTKTDLVVVDPYEGVTSGVARMSASLPAAQNGVFVGGQNNVITITYTTEEGVTYVKNIEQYITEIVIERISVAVKAGYGESYTNGYGSTVTGIKSGYVFTSSAVNVASTISNYITVTGEDTVGDTQEITAYSVSGSNVAGWQQFTVTFNQKGTPCAATVYVNVTAVEMVEISADFVQGETVVYAATDVSTLISETVVTGIYNDGSTVAINSGYTLSIVDENGDTLSAFDATLHNYIKVTYNGFSTIAETEVEVSNKWFTGVKITSIQTTNTIYVTASNAVVAANIRVEEVYSDESTGAVLAYNEVGGYTLEGSLLDGAVYVVYEKDGVEVSEQVTGLNITELEILSITIDATDVPEDYYLVFGIDTLKNYIKVTATYNDDRDHQEEIGADEYELSSNVAWNEAVWSSSEITASEKTYTITVTTTGNGTIASYQQVVKLGKISSIALVTRNSVPGPIFASANVDDYREYLEVTVNKTDNTQGTVQAGIGRNEFHLEGTSTVDGFYEFIVVINGVTFETNQTYASYDLSPVLDVTARRVATYTVTGEQGSRVVISGSANSSIADLFSVSVTYNDGSSKTLSYAEVADNDHYTIEGTLTAFEEETDQAISVVYRYLNTNTNVIVDTKSETRTIKVTPQRVSAMSVAYTSGSQSVTIYTSSAFNGSGEADLTRLKGLLNSSLTIKDIYNTGTQESTNSYSFADYEAGSGVSTNGGTVRLYVMTVLFEEQYDAVSAAYEAAPGDEGIAATYAAYEAARLAAYVDVQVTAVAPESITLALKSGATIYSSYTDEKIAENLVVKEVYNDGSDRELSLSVWDDTLDEGRGDYTDGYTLNVTAGSIVSGGKVSFNAVYYDNSVRREFTSNTLENVVVEKLTLTSVTVAVDNSVVIYQSSTEATLRSALTVTAHFNDSDSDTDVTNYILTIYTGNGALPASGSAPLNITYIFNGVGITTTTSVTVTPIVPEEIRAEYKESGATSVQLYTSGELESVKEKIEVKVTGSGNNDLGALMGTAYTLSMHDIVEEGTVGATQVTVKGTEYNIKARDNDTLVPGTYVVIVTYVHGGGTLTDGIILEVAAYEIATSNVVLSSGVTLYSDYVFAEEVDTIKSGLVMNATWNDGYNHSREYEFKVTDVTEIVGDKTRVYVTYNYTNKSTGIGDTGVTKQVALTLTAAEISDVRVEKAASYNLYTSDDKSKITDASVSTLYLVYNSGKEQATTWESYTYTIDAPNWTTGGEVGVTLNIEVNGKQYVKGLTYTVQPVVLDRIEIKSYASGEHITQSDTQAIYATSNATTVLSAITLNVEAVKNNGERSSVNVEAGMLSYEFTDGDADGEVTLSYTEGGITKTATFKVTLTKIALVGISAELKNTEAKIYTNGTVSVLSGYINVTAEYNDGSEKGISYGTNGYAFTRGDIDIGGATEPTEKTVEISYSEGGVSRTYEMTVTVSPATLISIKATYNQGTAKLYANGGIDGILEASALTVKATFETGTAGTTRQYESDIPDGYEVKYLENGEEADLPDGGRVGITVSYTLGGTTVNTVFYVTITAKAQTGIRVEYHLKENERIFNTTNTEARFIEKLNDISVYNVYNDGDETEGAVISKTAAELENETMIDGGLSVSINTSSNKWRISFTYNGFTQTKEDDWYTGQVKSITASVDASSDYVAYVGASATEIKNQLLKVYGKYDDKYVGDNGTAELDGGQYRVVFATGNSSTTIGRKALTVTYTGTTSYEVMAVDVNVYVHQKVEISNVGLKYQKRAAADDGTAQGEYSSWTVLTNNTLVGQKFYNVEATFIATDGAAGVKHLTLAITHGGETYTASDGLAYAEGVKAWANPASGTYEFALTVNGIFADDDVKDDASNSLFDFYANGIKVSNLSTVITVTRRAVTDYIMSYTPKSDVTIYTTSTFHEIMNVLGTLAITKVYNDGDREPITDELEYVRSEAEFSKGDDKYHQYTVLGYTEGKLPSGSLQFVVKYGGDGEDRYTNSYVTITEPQIVSYSVEWTNGVHVYYGDTIEQIVSGIKVYGTYNDYPASLSGNTIVYESDNPRSGTGVQIQDISAIVLKYNGAAFDGSYAPAEYNVSADVSKIANVSLTDATVKTVRIEIEKKEITGNDIRFLTSYTYTGEKIEAIPTVVVNGTTLTYGVDFECRYPGENVHVGSDAGEVTVKGIGTYYAGEATATFHILQADNEWVEALSMVGWTYGNNESQPTAVPKFGSAGNVVYRYYTDSQCRTEVTRKNELPSMDAGEYYVKATLAGTADYKDLESAALRFEVTAAEMTAYAKAERGIELSGYVVEYTYNGNSQMVSPATNKFSVLNAADTPLSAAVWKFAIKDNWNDVSWGLVSNEVTKAAAGTYTIQYNITCKNYADLKGSFTLIIHQADVTVTANAISVEYGGEPVATGYTYELANSQGMNKLYEDDEFTVGNVTYSWTYRAGDGVGSENTIEVTGGLTNDNYNITYAKSAVTVTPKAVTVTVLDKSSVYSEALVELEAEVVGEYELGDKVVYELTRGAGLVENAGANVYDILINVTANANYAITVLNEHGASEVVVASGVSAVKGVYEITKKAVAIVIVTGGSSVYGASIDVTHSSADSNAYTVMLKRGTDVYELSETVHAATYEIVVELGDSANYESSIEFKDKSGNAASAEYVVTPKTVAVVWSNVQGGKAVYAYTSNEIAIQASYTDISGVAVTALSYTETNGKTVKYVDNYEVTASTADTDYELTNTVMAIEVTKAALTITLNDTSVAAGTEPGDIEVTHTEIGKGSSDSIVVTPVISGYTTSTEAGSEKAITATYVITNADGSNTESNYTISVIPGTLYVVESGVTVAVTGVELNKSSASMAVGGETETLVATVKPGNATNKAVTWSSSNASVASVNNGVVTAVSAGSATITVTTKDGGKTAQCVVTVAAGEAVALTGISISKAETTVKVNETEVLVPVYTPENATNKAVTWSSSDTSVVTVSETGEIRGIKAGSATITATSVEGGKTATIAVTVEASDSAAITLSDNTLASFAHIVETKNNKGVVTKRKLTNMTELSIATTVAENGQTIYLSLAKDLMKWGDLSSIFVGATEVSARKSSGTAIKATGYIGTGAIITVDGTDIVVILKGDVNGDGKLNSTDYTNIKKYVLGEKELANEYAYAADSNSDGKLNSTDYTNVKNHVLGKKNIFA